MYKSSVFDHFKLIILVEYLLSYYSLTKFFISGQVLLQCQVLRTITVLFIKYYKCLNYQIL